MSYQVELTARAERDVAHIATWIASRSTRGAESWLNRFEEATQQLKSEAANCSLAPESGYGDTEIHQLIFKTRRGKPYRILFTIRDKLVLVRHVRGPGQDLVPFHEL
ncbi:type II toxin-antitoxin system RelE/ParE family toxin [Calycomorphotria hydatis]|uniref:Plasmid stabilization system protein n=1 Tax=Calycomorphotria hydatis TaxID=2528027 RepID=A0A517TDZ0_9PLAN|nr:type II toxin-antitoxin system RelE/ParE family toxin [Calycomorphotria hydatis]QDT66586.1 Plasmid stabilization system protein [Calycomorphotria hydatis]